MPEPLSLRVNGDAVRTEAEPDESLLDVLRDRLGLRAAKPGCREGECGACTVLLDGEPANACLAFALDCEGRSVITVEGLASGADLDPLQRAFVAHWATQCGYCTPGMVMAATALLRRNSRPTETDVRRALEGNLCRCTGYAKIVRAVLAAAEVRP